MSRTVLASLFAVLAATSAAPASAQVFYDPSTWFSAPARPCYLPRPMPRCYPRPRPVLDCPEGICGPVYRTPVNDPCADGFCDPVLPRYSNPPVLYNQWRAPQPWGGYYESRRPVQDDRMIPPDNDWTANRAPLPRRSYGPSSPFYP